MTGSLQPPGWIRDYRGKRYINGGHGPIGFDCYRLMAIVMNERYGNHVPLMTGVVADRGRGRGRFMADIRAKMKNHAGWIKVDAPRPGDGVSLLRGGHCGVVVAVRPRPAGHPPAGWMLHVHEDIDVTLAEFHSSEWENKVDGFERFVGETSFACAVGAEAGYG